MKLQISMSPKKYYKKVTRTTYDLIAEEYVKRDQDTVLETSEVHTALKGFIKLLPAQAKVLDIGSGGARDSRFLHKHGLHVIGIDFSRKMMAKSRKIQPRIFYKVMDLEQLQFAPLTFEGVWANASLHHIPKKRLLRVLKQVYTILQPGGIFFAKVKYGVGEGLHTNTKFGKRITRYFAFYRVRELSRLIQGAGLKIISAHIGPRKEWVDVFAQKSD